MQTMADGHWLVSGNVLEGGEEQSLSYNREECGVLPDQRNAHTSCPGPSVFLILHPASLFENCPCTFVYKAERVPECYCSRINLYPSVDDLWSHLSSKGIKLYGLFVLGLHLAPASSLGEYYRSLRPSSPLIHNKILDKSFKLLEPHSIYLLSRYTNMYFIVLCWWGGVTGNATSITHFHNNLWFLSLIMLPGTTHLSFPFNLPDSLPMSQDITPIYDLQWPLCGIPTTSVFETGMVFCCWLSCLLPLSCLSFAASIKTGQWERWSVLEMRLVRESHLSLAIHWQNDSRGVPYGYQH